MRFWQNILRFLLKILKKNLNFFLARIDFCKEKPYLSIAEGPWGGSPPDGTHFSISKLGYPLQKCSNFVKLKENI